MVTWIGMKGKNNNKNKKQGTDTKDNYWGKKIVQ